MIHIGSTDRPVYPLSATVQDVRVAGQTYELALQLSLHRMVGLDRFKLIDPVTCTYLLIPAGRRISSVIVVTRTPPPPLILS